jgi:hypothetical protein
MSLMLFVHGAAAAAKSFLLCSARNGDPERSAEEIFERAGRLLSDPAYLDALEHLENAQDVVSAVLDGRAPHGALSVPAWCPPAPDAPEVGVWRDVVGM